MAEEVRDGAGGGEGEGEEIVTRGREGVFEKRCVVEPKKSGENRSGGGDAEETSVWQMLATVSIGV